MSSASPSIPGLSQPMTRGTILHSMASACRSLWGEDGYREVVDRLPSATREATTGAGFSTLTFYPTQYAMDWDLAKMEGPAHGDEEAFRESVRLGMDLGFGRVRRVFLSFATPVLLARRASELWRHDHTHGRLEIDPEERPGHRRLTLSDHPFTTTALSRVAISEALRHILSLSRIRHVRESHAMSGDSLVIAFTWDS